MIQNFRRIPTLYFLYFVNLYPRYLSAFIPPARPTNDRCSYEKYVKRKSNASISEVAPRMYGDNGDHSCMQEQTTPRNQSIYTIRLPEEYRDEMIHDFFMDLALEQAQVAREKGEVPIGAVIVGRYDDETISTDRYETRNRTNQCRDRMTFRVISKAHNLVETNIDASAHAELLALRQGARNLKNWRYPPNCTLYTTLEPCPMCLSSIQAFRIDNLVYGAPDHRLGAVETHMNLLSIVKHPYHEIKSVVGGVQEEKCGGIVVDFFRERRKIKKESKSLTLHDEG
ncbi:hypothetical protein HJC23_009114 [Cyclotella cryptica]|uniref:CMP/dCMP-type deaminase domain-containing protein n=1 Tax=Cyclotella cryptica TaxID=29204 RepID=A0ABD3QYN9_9STRA